MRGKSGLYKFKVNTKDFPGNSIEYFFAVKTNDGKIYGAPVNDQNILEPIKKIFLDPVKYYEQKTKMTAKVAHSLGENKHFFIEG